jgi:hypothetical protein
VAGRSRLMRKGTHSGGKKQTGAERSGKRREEAVSERSGLRQTGTGYEY